MNKKEKQVQISTLIGKDAELSGDFSVKGSARIDGKINGNVAVDGTLIIGSSGCINGNVAAKDIAVGGEILGDVFATDKTELTATARVLGDITTSVIVIDENAIFQGKCDMNQGGNDKRSKARVSKATRAGKKTAKDAIVEALKEVEEANKGMAEADDLVVESLAEN